MRWAARTALLTDLYVSSVVHNGAYSPFSGRFTNSQLLLSSCTHSVTQTTSSSDLDTFFSFFIGKIVTVGIVSRSETVGIGAHKEHSSPEVLDSGTLVCYVRLIVYWESQTYLCIGFTAILQWTFRTQRIDGFANLTTKFHQCLRSALDLN